MATAFLMAGWANAGPPLTALSAADVAVNAARGGPAVVVVWSPDCLACRKSLAEIARFRERAMRDGIVVRTVVSDDVREEAQAMVSKRELALSVEADAGGLDAASRRVLLDRPIAYAIDRRGEVVGVRAGLLGAWGLDELAALARQPVP